MSDIEDKLWEHLVEHHGADRAQLRSATTLRTHRRRPVVVGMAATGLAAVGVATVLATSSGSGSPAANGPSAGPIQIEDTAYIVKRVKAKVAADNPDGTVLHVSNYFSGDESSEGSLDLGPKSGDGYDYAAPDGAEYSHGMSYNKDGSPRLIGFAVVGPEVNGKQSVSETSINRANHTYGHTQTEVSDPAGRTRRPRRPWAWRVTV